VPQGVFNTILYENESQNPQIFQQIISLFPEQSNLQYCCLLHMLYLDKTCYTIVVYLDLTFFILYYTKSQNKTRNIKRPSNLFFSAVGPNQLQGLICKLFKSNLKLRAAPELQLEGVHLSKFIFSKNSNNSDNFSKNSKKISKNYDKFR
jgi:hypothetical protein